MLSNFVLQTTSAPGSGSNGGLITAPAGRLNFNQKFTSGAQAYYFMDDGTLSEWGYGALTTGSPDIFSRDKIIGNSAATTVKLNFAGTTRIYNELPGERTVYKDAAGVVTTGLFTATEPANGVQTVLVTNTASNGANLKLTGNGATTPSKTLRAISGHFAIINNAVSAKILVLSDAGALSAPSTITGAGEISTSTITGVGISSTSTLSATGAITGSSTLNVGAATVSSLSSGSISGSTISASGAITGSSTLAVSGNITTTTGNVATSVGSVGNATITAGDATHIHRAT